MVEQRGFIQIWRSFWVESLSFGDVYTRKHDTCSMMYDIPAKVLDLELDLEVFFLSSCGECSMSCLDCALGVDDQSLTGATEVCNGGGEIGLADFCAELAFCYRLSPCQLTLPTSSSGGVTKISPSCAAGGVVLLAEVGDNLVFCGDSSMISPELEESRFQASKPCGACITELGCSSSSDRGFEACSAASVVSSCTYQLLPSRISSSLQTYL